MKAGLFLLLWMTVVSAQACRCMQQNLADYFNAAQEVVIARLVDWEPVDGDTSERSLQVELVAPVYKGPVRGGDNAGDRRLYRTADNSAGCGLAPDTGSIYVFFAQLGGRDDSDAPLQVNSCSGSRVLFSSDGDNAEGFSDVPARFVVQQLNGLAGLEVLRAVASHLPDPANSRNDSLVGLLDVAGFSHAGFALLFERPARDRTQARRVRLYDDLETREIAYEAPAAVVYAVLDGWYRLRLKSGEFAWLPAEYAGRFFPYEELPVRRLTYIRRPWHGFVWPQPGAGLPIRASAPDGQREQAVAVLDTTVIADSVWFRIELLDASPCDGGAAKAGIAGWVPAYRETGEPLVWYYSRGC